ncbi:hypothetical protein LCGC14_1618970 [marine sediment metagenome]|uniref:Uncharacterized protein n=1 Tax=marine sediment metagenome TaxID=412755 RepID=A0A0F9L615_9ZZZZ
MVLIIEHGFIIWDLEKHMKYTGLENTDSQAINAGLERRRRYLTFKHGLWLLKMGLRETHMILLISSDFPIGYG